MNVSDTLDNAAMEHKTSDYSPGVKGRFWFNTTAGVPKYDNGSTINLFGSNATSSGTKIDWVEDQNSPLAVIENQNQIYSFQQVLGQSLYAWIRVPLGYAAATQLNLRFLFYCPNSSGNILLQTVATLIRPGTDLITSTTNQRTSTNSAVTLSASTVNVPQAVIADLTSSTGTINSVSVSAGDLVKIQLIRNISDTCIDDAKVLVNSLEVTYS